MSSPRLCLGPPQSPQILPTLPDPPPVGRDNPLTAVCLPVLPGRLRVPVPRVSHRACGRSDWLCFVMPAGISDAIVDRARRSCRCVDVMPRYWGSVLVRQSLYALGFVSIRQIRYSSAGGKPDCGESGVHTVPVREALSGKGHVKSLLMRNGDFLKQEKSLRSFQEL